MKKEKLLKRHEKKLFNKNKEGEDSKKQQIRLYRMRLNKTNNKQENRRNKRRRNRRRKRRNQRSHRMDQMRMRVRVLKDVNEGFHKIIVMVMRTMMSY